jgi:hypothetical protein
MWIAIVIVAAWMLIFVVAFTRAVRQERTNRIEWQANLKEWSQQDAARRARLQQ